MVDIRLRPCPPRWQLGSGQLMRFVRDEDGAVTVDWVVLTAAVIGLGFAVIRPIVAGATDVSGSIGAELTAAQVNLNGVVPGN